MEHGVFKGIVVQKAFKMGYVGVRETMRMLREKTMKKCEFRLRACNTGKYVFRRNRKLLFPSIR